MPKTFVTKIEALADNEKMQAQIENLDWTIYYENEKLQGVINSKAENWPVKEFNTFQSENWPDKVILSSIGISTHLTSKS